MSSDPQTVVNLFLSFLRPIVVLVVFPIALTTCLPSSYNQSQLGFVVGVVEAAHYSVTQNEPPMCGASGVAQLHNDHVLHCRVPFGHSGPRKRGFEFGLERWFSGDLLREPPLLWHAKKLATYRMFPAEFLESDALRIPRDRRIAAVLGFSARVEDPQQLLQASTDEVLAVVGNDTPIHVSRVSTDGEQRLVTILRSGGQTFAYDFARNLVIDLETP